MPSRTLNVIPTTLLVTLFTCGAVAGAAPSITPTTAQEASQEAAEETAENAEDAAAAPFDAMESTRDQHYAEHIEKLKARIQKLHARKRFIREHISHKTNVYKEHLPKKQHRIRAARVKIQELRAREAETA
jgi:hypothetical protein